MSAFLQRSQHALQISFSLSDFPKQQLVMVSPSVQKTLRSIRHPSEKERNPPDKISIFGQGQRETTHQEKSKRVNLQGTGGPTLGPTGRGFR